MFLAAMGWLLVSPALADIYIDWHVARGRLSLTSWKEKRDAGIVKQDHDYSCGAASLATLLNRYYGQTLTEDAILKELYNGEARASFEEMQRALSKFGFRALGLASSYAQLIQLKMPVIVYLKHRKDDHFSVLYGIDAETVWLADPSQGHRSHSRAEFLDMWHTRADNLLPGKFLAVFPSSPTIKPVDGFFTSVPTRHSLPALRQLQSRQF
ncbi:C39 family peptidase [Paludibacterium sp. THUN1379]|uniref:C39 family peptidase n=1 Tax=Paludibacterium sp. THUN1379 TaxID=3112107 RepID=UPI0030CC2094